MLAYPAPIYLPWQVCDESSGIKGKTTKPRTMNRELSISSSACSPVGRSEIEDAFNAIESGCTLTRGLTTRDLPDDSAAQREAEGESRGDVWSVLATHECGHAVTEIPGSLGARG
jgi:hypothetical protein